MKKDRYAIVGQSLPKIDAWAKVVGETKFADDLAMSRMAHGKLLRSPHPHALIKRIDTTRARTLPGSLSRRSASTSSGDSISPACPRRSARRSAGPRPRRPTTSRSAGTRRAMLART